MIATSFFILCKKKITITFTSHFKHFKHSGNEVCATSTPKL